jgi:flagellar hook-basal body complex protein FliE
MAQEDASTALQLTMAVRNKVLEAYQELSRMQV